MNKFQTSKKTYIAPKYTFEIQLGSTREPQTLLPHQKKGMKHFFGACSGLHINRFKIKADTRPTDFFVHTPIFCYQSVTKGEGGMVKRDLGVKGGWEVISQYFREGGQKSMLELSLQHFITKT